MLKSFQNNMKNLEKIEWIEVENRILEIIRISRELSDMTGRPFTIDGHLLGSIGEVHAAYAYGVELYPPGNKMHDGEISGHEVQIKITQGSDVALKGEYDRLLVFRIDEHGVIDEVYNGDGKRPWKRLEDDGIITSSNGEKACTLNKLKELSKTVDPKDRVRKIR